VTRALVLLALLVTGCPRQQCLVQDTRCVGQRAEICTAGGEWHPLADCAAAGGQCALAHDEVNGTPVEGHACVPAEAP